MSDGPSVDGQVPRLPEVEHVVRVPPVPVELAVGEAQDLNQHSEFEKLLEFFFHLILYLADGVEEGVEDEVEPHQPDEVVGDRQLEQSLDRLEDLHFL